jgi:hypothetical protein
MPNGTYGGVRGGAGDDPTYSICAPGLVNGRTQINTDERRWERESRESDESLLYHPSIRPPRRTTREYG